MLRMWGLKLTIRLSIWRPLASAPEILVGALLALLVRLCGLLRGDLSSWTGRGLDKIT